MKIPILKFIARRLLLGVGTLFLASLIIFLVTQALPSDPAGLILGREATPEALAALREQFGLNRPLFVQFFSWWGNLLTGDLGVSFSSQANVSDFIVPRIGYSLFLLLVSGLASIPLALVIGSYAALKRDSRFDKSSSITTLLLAAMPEFVVGTVLVILFATSVVQWLPAVSYFEEGAAPWSDPLGLVLPVVTLIISVTPYVVRVMRAAMVEVLEADYVEMARLKGMDERTVLWRHAAPNAIGPTFQVIALNLAYLAGGVIVIERLFNYPGMGSSLAESVVMRDLPVLQFLALVIAGIYVLMNLLADIGTVLATPRLRTTLQ
jgi:peptide/nickel transport system permease protein